MNFLYRLLTGCWRDHDDRRERDPRGRYWLVCATCGDRRQVLPKQKLKVRKEAAKVFTLAKRKVG